MEKIPPPPPYEESTHSPPLNNYPQAYPPQSRNAGYPTLPPPQMGFPPPPQVGFHQPGFIPPPTPSVPQAQYSRYPQPQVVTVFGPIPQLINCPHCHNQVTSKLEASAGTKTHLFAALLCILGCIPCCLIPYCVDSCKDRSHYCPQCNAFLGSYGTALF
uniref:LITAF domain-containing protein n=1 Tax=Photinus pyralis TaxID=7054 RepID=A0A1Y1N874_PHOPY